ncbi:hypothetical protein [Homoserinibacter sp. GY 40078]|uniref:hypothetical protein n=1 Tax=Homoserinibacter sp. GY 40078 TaxID=2603275 RepID=UPI0011CA2E4D|nr:hypothetical protein [Homoserinibacter sp. GY 40078]TXK17411.1 hypothetical protein FVQ89_11290 [Homoserinibacter sp. GY 40078]
MTLVQIASQELALSGNNYPGVALRATIWRDNSGSGVDAAANEEDVYAKVMLIKRGPSSAGTSSYNANGVCSASAVVNGSTRYSSGGLSYDFRSSSGRNETDTVQMLWEGWVAVPHASDGRKTLNYSAQWVGDSNLGSRSVSGSVSLPRITVAPNTPTATVATRVSDSEVTVGWAQTNPGHGTPTSNRIERRINGGAWADASTVSPTTSVSLSCSSNQRLEYRVRATNGAGASAWSAASAPVFTTPALPTAFTVAKDAALDINLAWTPNVGYTEHEHVIEWSGDGGSTWAPLATVPAGTSTFKHADPDPAETHTYQVRARATSGGLASEWVRSATVQLLAPPNKPTIPTIDAYQSKSDDFVLSWSHNPVDTTPQSAYQMQSSTDGGATWATGEKTATPTSAYTVAGGTHDAEVALTLRVRTWGQATSGGSDEMGASPWSDPETVTFKTRPVVTIDRPADGETWLEAELDVALGFTQSEGATFVRAVVTLMQGEAVLEQILTTTLASTKLATRVLDGGSYMLRVTALDSNGLSSVAAVADFDVAYTLPVAAGVGVTYLRESGVAQLDLAFPDPDEGEAAAARVTVTRAIDGGREETVIANYPIDDPTLTVLDTTPTIHGANSYRVRTISADGAVADIVELLETTEEWYAFLSTGEGFARIVSFHGNLKFDSSPSRAVALVVTAGRRNPIALFGENRSLVVSGSASLAPGVGSAPKEIDEFLLDAEIVCYRDPSGRRIFGAVSGSVSSPSSRVQEFRYRVTEAS